MNRRQQPPSDDGVEEIEDARIPNFDDLYEDEDDEDGEEE
jgi:hypothetical protein